MGLDRSNTELLDGCIAHALEAVQHCIHIDSGIDAMTKAGAYDMFSVTMVMAAIGSMNTKRATTTAYSLRVENKQTHKKTVVHFFL